MLKLKFTENQRNRLFPLIIVLLALCALGIRVFRIAERPLHCDEAVQAVKFGKLLEDGSYEYDPLEYHGPTLYYISLLVTKLSGTETFADVNAVTLRIQPAIFGSALILLMIPVAGGIGRGGAVVAAVLTAISPFMLFFSRYYIQEMLLVFFTCGVIVSAWLYTRKRTPLRVALIGLCFGLMFATKETCVIAWFAMALSFALTAGRKTLRIFKMHPWHIVLLIFSAFFAAGIFFSSFGTHPAGLLEAVTAFPRYFARAGGEGHEHSWFYYLQILFYHRQQGVFWSEWLILILAIWGGVRAFLPKKSNNSTLPRFLTFYTVIICVIYSSIPYKTPWLALNFLHPAIILAGTGAAGLLIDLRGRIAQTVCLLLLLCAGVNLAHQAWRGSFYYYADKRNPCVYSHTSTDTPRFTAQLHDIAALHSEGVATTVKIIAPEYWPLPWYLRDFTRVGYWHTIPENPQAPIIITSPEMVDELKSKLHGDYFTTIFGLRPGVLLYAIIRQDLWDTYIEEISR